MKQYISLFLCAVLSACSVSQVHLHYVPVPVEKYEPIKTCAKFVLPDLVSVPPAPIDEYSAALSRESSHRIHVLVDYIEKLRLHISETKRHLNANYQRYLTDCLAE